MADQDAPHTAKGSNLKGFRNRLKKVFGRDKSPNRSNSPPANVVPTSTITTDPEEAARLRVRYTHFRILVIGRANAGKTTLLKRVCNAEEDPVYEKVRYMRLALYPTLIIPSLTD
jgi:predicted GTPase